MHRYSDLNSAKLHIQELYAEAGRFRQIKNSKLFEPIDQTRWYIRSLDRVSAWVARWKCMLQGRLPQSMFTVLNNLALAPNPCTCMPEPCKE